MELKQKPFHSMYFMPSEFISGCLFEMKYLLDFQRVLFSRPFKSTTCTSIFFRSIGITAPSLSSLTNTEYIHSLANSTLSNLVLTNNPSMILLYCIAMVHEINEQSRQVTSTTVSQELSLRTKVRNAVTLAAMGLPLESLHEMEQTAFILEHLTVSGSFFNKFA